MSAGLSFLALWMSRSTTSAFCANSVGVAPIRATQTRGSRSSRGLNRGAGSKLADLMALGIFRDWRVIIQNAPYQMQPAIFFCPIQRYVSVQLTGCPGVPLTHVLGFVSVATGLLDFSAGVSWA